MPALLQIAIGGAIGALLRYAGVLAVARGVAGGFPWGTMAVNVTGSFLMGIAAIMVSLRAGQGLAGFAPFLMTGVLGGFTTFSAFSLEAFLLLERGRVLAATGYVAGSVALSLGALAAGVWLARGMNGA